MTTTMTTTTMIDSTLAPGAALPIQWHGPRGPSAMSTIRAIYENGVFRPTGPIDLPEGTEVEIEARPVEESPSSVPEDGADDGLDAVYEILSRRYRSGRHDLAERHNEHQPRGRSSSTPSDCWRSGTRMISGTSWRLAPSIVPRKRVDDLLRPRRVRQRRRPRPVSPGGRTSPRASRSEGPAHLPDRGRLAFRLGWLPPQ